MYKRSGEGWRLEKRYQGNAMRREKNKIDKNTEEPHKKQKKERRESMGMDVPRGLNDKQNAREM
jgi:hypothetical protein